MSISLKENYTGKGAGIVIVIKYLWKGKYELNYIL